MTARCATCLDDKPLAEFSPLRRGSFRKHGVRFCFACNDCASEIAETVVNNHIDMKLHRASGFLISRNGFAFTHEEGALILVGWITSSGYLSLPSTNGRRLGFTYVHRIVFELFRGAPIPSHNERGQRLVIAHRDDQKLNNAFENLEIITQSQNLKNAFSTGASSRAPRQAHPIIATNCTTGEIIRFVSMYQAGKTLNIVRGAISFVCSQKTHTAKNRTTGDKYTFVFA